MDKQVVRSYIPNDWAEDEQDMNEMVEEICEYLTDHDLTEADTLLAADMLGYCN